MTGTLLIPAGVNHPTLQAGHSEVPWDTADPASVEQARELYRSLTSGAHDGLRYRAAKLTSGVDGELLSEFDPNAGTIMFIVPTAGG